MKKFVNREAELLLVDEAVQMLQDGQLLAGSAIVEFCGIHGIGKTTLLQQIEETCRTKQVLCERRDIGEISAQFLAESLQKLLDQAQPVVVILDSFDSSSGKELKDFELKLRDLIFKYSNLLIVLASKSAYHFDNTRSIAGELTIHQLRPLSRDDALSYLADIGQEIAPDVRELIYQWTQGYPLAMDLLVDATLTQQLDPRVPQDQQTLVAMLTDQIINQNLLTPIRSDPAQLDRFHKLLSTLSLPRSFNLVVMQRLIEQYASEYALKSSLAYITQPNEINKIIDIISWDMRQSGYCIDSSVRNLFLLKLRIENPPLYTAMNKYLMEMNKRFALEVPGSDSIRYLREYLYHFAKSGATSIHPEILLEDLDQLVKKDPPDQFLRFYEEFWQDEDLRKTLGSHAREVITFLRKRFIELYKQLPEGPERTDYLLLFFSHTIPAGLTKKPSLSILTREEIFLILEPAIRQIMQEENAEIYTKFYDVLSHDQALKRSLGKDFERIRLLFAESSSGER